MLTLCATACHLSSRAAFDYRFRAFPTIRYCSKYVKQRNNNAWPKATHFGKLRYSAASKRVRTKQIENTAAIVEEDSYVENCPAHALVPCPCEHPHWLWPPRTPLDHIRRTACIGPSRAEGRKCPHARWRWGYAR